MSHTSLVSVVSKFPCIGYKQKDHNNTVVSRFQVGVNSKKDYNELIAYLKELNLVNENLQPIENSQPLSQVDSSHWLESSQNLEKEKITTQPYLRFCEVDSTSLPENKFIKPKITPLKRNHIQDKINSCSPSYYSSQKEYNCADRFSKNSQWGYSSQNNQRSSTEVPKLVYSTQPLAQELAKDSQRRWSLSQQNEKYSQGMSNAIDLDFFAATQPVQNRSSYNQWSPLKEDYDFSLEEIERSVTEIPSCHVADYTSDSQNHSQRKSQSKIPLQGTVTEPTYKRYKSHVTQQTTQIVDKTEEAVTKSNKSLWDRDEDLILMYMRNEQKLSWSDISTHLKKTENACKYRWKKLRIDISYLCPKINDIKNDNSNCTGGTPNVSQNTNSFSAESFLKSIGSQKQPLPLKVTTSAPQVNLAAEKISVTEDSKQKFKIRKPTCMLTPGATPPTHSEESIPPNEVARKNISVSEMLKLDLSTQKKLIYDILKDPDFVKLVKKVDTILTDNSRRNSVK